jgi:hypothetical protein
MSFLYPDSFAGNTVALSEEHSIDNPWFAGLRRYFTADREVIEYGRQSSKTSFQHLS